MGKRVAGIGMACEPDALLGRVEMVADCTPKGIAYGFLRPPGRMRASA